MLSSFRIVTPSVVMAANTPAGTYSILGILLINKGSEPTNIQKLGQLMTKQSIKARTGWSS